MAKTLSNPRQLTKAILKELKGVADERQREVLMSFFKTGKGESGEGDKFLGVKVPQIRAIVKAHWAECTDADVDALITSPCHEARLSGLLVLCKRYKAAKGNVAAQAQVVEEYLGYTAYINNWDLVDLTAYELLGDWYLTRDRSPPCHREIPGASPAEVFERERLKVSRMSDAGMEEAEKTPEERE